MIHFYKSVSDKRKDASCKGPGKDPLQQKA